VAIDPRVADELHRLRASVRGGDDQQTVAVQASKTNAPQFALEANPRRTKLEIENLSSIDIEWGNPKRIQAGAQLFGQFRRVKARSVYIDDAPACYKGAVAILANVVGPVDVRVTEEFRS
jgi:hypothetical protein